MVCKLPKGWFPHCRPASCVPAMRHRQGSMCVCVRMCACARQKHAPEFIACPATHIYTQRQADTRLTSTLAFAHNAQSARYPAQRRHAMRNKSTATQQAISPAFSLGAPFGCIWLVKADRGPAMPQRTAG